MAVLSTSDDRRISTPSHASSHEDLSVGSSVPCDEVLPLSIVVISYRRHEELLLCLNDLTEQRSKFCFEVVLILQAYQQGIPEHIEREYSGRLRLRIFEFQHGLGVHGARNAALSRVAGNIVAFLDDDVRVPVDWVETLIPYYDEKSIGGVGGYVRHPGCRRLTARILRPLLGLSSRRYRIDWGGFHTIPWSSHPERDQPADWLSGCNMSFRRSILEHIGGFDATYGSYGFDDVDISLRVRAAGWKLVSSRRLEVAHFPSSINRPSLTDLTREEEARRLILVNKAIGGSLFWRARYILRFSLHLIALLLQGTARGSPEVVLSAITGARSGWHHTRSTRSE